MLQYWYIVVPLIILALSLTGFALYVFERRKKFQRRLYKPKGPYLLSKSETTFFNALSHAIDDSLYICPKVRIADLIEVDIPESDSEFWSTFNKISQKHVDFVLCSRNDFSPLLVIELDGGSHNDVVKKKRDEFVDSVFRDAEISILHIMQSLSSYQNLEKQLKDILTNSDSTRGIR